MSGQDVKNLTQVEFRECVTCAAKPGSPTLCPACLHNRGLVMDLQEKLGKVSADLDEAYRGITSLREERTEMRSIADYRRDAIHQIPDLGEDEDYQVAVRRVVRERERLLGEVKLYKQSIAGVVRDQLSEVIGSLIHVYVGNPAIKGLPEIVDDLRRVRDRLANTSSQEGGS